MKNIRYKEAIELASWRKGSKITDFDAGCFLWPDKQSENIRVQISQLMTNQKKSVDPEVLYKFCEFAGVDPNFIFRFPSQHDLDYVKMVEKQLEDKLS